MHGPGRDRLPAASPARSQAPSLAGAGRHFLPPPRPTAVIGCGWRAAADGDGKSPALFSPSRCACRLAAVRGGSGAELSLEYLVLPWHFFHLFIYLFIFFSFFEKKGISAAQLHLFLFSLLSLHSHRRLLSFFLFLLLLLLPRGSAPFRRLSSPSFHYLFFFQRKEKERTNSQRFFFPSFSFSLSFHSP